MTIETNNNYPIYKGFVPGKNQSGCEKQPAMKFTEQYFTNLQDLESSPNVLGVLNQDIVMIDTDTQEDTQAFIRLLQACKLTVPYLITDKGMHFYFRDPAITSAQTSVMLCCGVVVDIKLGNRNGLDLIRKHNQPRNGGYFDAPLIPVPYWALPINDFQRNNLTTLAGLKEGSRNQNLFAMVGRIKRTGLTYEQCLHTINLINYNVISAPLPKHEINMLCRKDSFNNSVEVKAAAPQQQPNHTPIKELCMSNDLTTIEDNAQDDQQKFNPAIYAKELVRVYNIKLIDSVPYMYNHGEYVPLNDLDFERVVWTIKQDSHIRHRSEIKAAIKILAPQVMQDETDTNRKYINFSNGLLNIEDNSITPHSPTLFVPNLIPHEISMEPRECPELDKFISEISSGNEDTINQIYEMAGLCLYRRNFVRGCYILVGPKANGKSTFLKFLNYCLGSSNTSALKLHQVSEKFYTQMLNCKLANLGDDISDAYISDSSTLKSIITSDTILVDVKNKAPFEMVPYSTLIFSANSMPRSTDATKALLDRLVIVPFTAQFTKENGNLNFNMADVLHQPHVASEFLRRAVIALQRIRQTGKLTIGTASAELKRDYEIENNSVLSFLTDPLGLDSDVDTQLNKVPLQDVYVRYTDYCRIGGLSPMSRIAFTRFMRHQLNNVVKKVIKLEGNTHNAFCREDEDKPITLNF